jgi:hypothetical protein
MLRDDIFNASNTILHIGMFHVELFGVAEIQEIQLLIRVLIKRCRFTGR